MSRRDVELAMPTAKPVGIVVWLADPKFPLPAWDAFASVGLIVALPQDGPWWVERGDDGALSRVRREVLPELRAEHKLPIALAGQGRGGSGALTLAFRLCGDVSVVLTDTATVDLHEAYGYGTELDELYISREACRQDGAILAVDPFRTPASIRFHCSPDHPAHRGNDRLHEKLSALGIEHTWSETVPQAEEYAAWLAGELAKSGRRLL